MQPFATLSVGGGYLFATVPYIYSLSVAPGTQTLLGARSFVLGWVSTLTYWSPTAKTTGISLSCACPRVGKDAFSTREAAVSTEFSIRRSGFRGPWPKQTANRLSALGMRLYLQMGDFRVESWFLRRLPVA